MPGNDNLPRLELDLGHRGALYRAARGWRRERVGYAASMPKRVLTVASDGDAM